MGKRAFLIKQAVIAEIFEHRGKDWGALIRVCGPELPADAKIRGVAYVPPAQAFALVYESAEWSDLVVGGQKASQVNGVTVIEGKCPVFMFIINNPSDVPGCAILGVDEDAVPLNTPPESEIAQCPNTETPEG